MFISFNGLRLLLLSILLILASISYAEPPTVDNFTFGQLDWYNADRILEFSDSSWGTVSFDIVNSTSEIYYLNILANKCCSGIAIGEGWLVKNFAVLPSKLTRYTVDFDINLLGLSSGEDLATLTFCYDVDNEVQDVSPCQPSSEIIVSSVEHYVFTGGLDIPLLPDSIEQLPSPFGIQASEEITYESSKHDLRPVREDVGSCMAGAFARSIDWLNRKYSLGIEENQQQIYKSLNDNFGPYPERKETETDSEYLERSLEEYKRRLEFKAKYLDARAKSSGKRGASTKILDVTNLFKGKEFNNVVKVNGVTDFVKWMKKEMETEDVELHYGKHIVAIVQIIEQGGKIFIDYLDDLQGDNLADKETKRGELRGGFFRAKGKITFAQVDVVVSESLPVELAEFEAISNGHSINLTWLTGTETDNAGFSLYRATKNQYGNYEVTSLESLSHFEQVSPQLNEDCLTKIQGQLKVNNSSQFPKLIPAIGNSTESTCYSFTDTSNLDDGTYYYLLEDINSNGESTFHCKHIDAVTVGQGPAIDLKLAKKYCKKVTDSNN